MEEGTKAESSNIWEAIANIYPEVGFIEKDGKVEYGKTKYKFVGEAAFIGKLRPLFIREKIIILNVGNEAKQVGGNVIVEAKYKLFHVPSGTYEIIASSGEGMDSGDKATPKANTIALKYALRQTFLIETGDDPDKYASDELVASKKRKEEVDAEKAEAELVKGFAVKIKEAMAKITDVEAFNIAYRDVKAKKIYTIAQDKYPESFNIITKAFEQKEAQFKDTSSELADVMDELDSEVGYE